MIPIENINKANDIYKKVVFCLLCLWKCLFNLGKELRTSEEVQVPLSNAIEREREIANPQDLILISEPPLAFVRQNHILTLYTTRVRIFESLQPRERGY